MACCVLHDRVLQHNSSTHCLLLTCLLYAWCCCWFCSPSGAASSSIFRTATSRYTTYEQSTLEDLKCQICLNTLKNCVALEPCGHNFCATCLSHHLGNQLQNGLQLSCPFRWVNSSAIWTTTMACKDPKCLGQFYSSSSHGPDRDCSFLMSGV